MIFVDTNYFLRFLLADNAEQFQIAKKLFASGAAGKKSLFTSTIVIFEIYRVLSSYYGQQKIQLIDTLEKILRLEFIVLSERPILYNTIDLFRQNSLSLEDCYNLAYLKNNSATELATFDRELLKTFHKFSAK
jgi:predicted nucleic-acid-binding protein